MDAWATKSLEQRVALFKRRYPNSKINVYKLRKLYEKLKIKNKVIRKNKILDRAGLEKITIQAAEMANDVQMAIERKFRIVQVDECYVNKNTLLKTAWSLKKSNVVLDYKQLPCEVKAITAAVSREYGLDHIEVFSHSITKIKFKLFLEGLRRKHPFDDIMLVMDQLSMHKSTDVKELMNELGFLYTYTPAYAPQYNGIEEVFGIAKQTIKKKRLDNMLGNDREDLVKMIYNSFNSLNPHHIAKCVSRSLSILGLDAY